MKCKELMTNDWVSDKYGYLMQITVIGDGYVSFEDDEGNLCQLDDKCNQPEPIPLTYEILEKNGWKRHEIFMDIKADENFNINFSWTDRYGESLFQNGYYMCDCKYVHTLQHALRLCGLDELADNFKI